MSYFMIAFHTHTNKYELLNFFFFAFNIIRVAKKKKRKRRKNWNKISSQKTRAFIKYLCRIGFYGWKQKKKKKKPRERWLRKTKCWE